MSAMTREEGPYRSTLEDFREGQVIHHWPRKTITESDNNLFCLLTWNHHPVHSDHEYAAQAEHGRVLVVGTYVLSIVVGMSVPEVSGSAIANLEYEKITHDGPVYLGDTLRAQTEVLGVRRSRNKPDRGVLHVETTAFKQTGEKVLTLRRKILLPAKDQG